MIPSAITARPWRLPVLILAAAFSSAGCSEGAVASDASIADATLDGAVANDAPVDSAVALTVIETSPEDQAAGVDRSATITATFSRDVAADTIDEATFTVTLDGVNVAGAVSYSEGSRVATFHPDTELAPLGSYTATITTGVTDAAGTPLAIDSAWTFTVRDRQWGPPQLVELGAGGAYASQIAFDSSGNATAVWQQSDGTRDNIWANRFVPGTGWGAAALLETDDAGFAQNPQIAIDPSGNATAVWSQYDGTHNNIRSNRFVPGAGWGTATLVETDDAYDAHHPRVAVDPAGNATAVWYQYDGTPRRSIWTNRLVPGAGWGTATLIATDMAIGAGFPQVAVDPAGSATVVWPQSDGTRSSVWARRYLPGTGWGTAALLETDDAGDAGAPKIAADAAGNAIAVWSQFDGTRNNSWASRYVVGTGWGVATPLETDNIGTASNPQVAVDPSGEATAVWQQSDGSRDNIWANRYVPGSGWGSALLLEADDVGPAAIPQVAARSGTATAVWHQSDGSRLNIWANRYVPGSGWGTATLLETNNVSEAFDAQIAVDSSGNSVAVWSQSDGVNTSIWASAFR